MTARSTSGHGQRFGAVFTSLVVFSATGIAILIATLFLTFMYWKAAVAANIVLAVLTYLHWRKRATDTAASKAALGAVAVGVPIAVFSFIGTWLVHAEHDALLSTMSEKLCSVEIPEGASLGSCGGRISNTGNGNSCRYLTSVMVRGDGDEIVQKVVAQGFHVTEVDTWGYPIEDGPSYVSPYEEDEVRLTHQVSWADDEGDLRCT